MNKKHLDDLITFIKNNPPQSRYYDCNDWRKALDDSVPNWKEVIKQESNWDILKEVKARLNNEELWELFIEVAGGELLHRCFNSTDSDLRR